MRLLKAERGLPALLALLVLVSSLLVTGLPRLIDGQYDHSLRGWAHDKGNGATDITVSGQVTTSHPVNWMDPHEELPAVAQQLGKIMGPLLHRVSGPIDANAQTPMLYLPDRQNTQATWLTYDPGAADRVQYIAGAAPANPPVHQDRNGQLPQNVQLQVGISRTAAAVLNLKVGQVLRLSFKSSQKIVLPTLRISGIYQPVDLRDPYWASRPSYVGVTKVTLPKDVWIPTISTALDAAGYDALWERTSTPTMLSWHIPIDVNSFQAADTSALRSEVANFSVGASNFIEAVTTMQATTSLGNVLAGFSRQFDSTRAIMALALGGLDGVGLGVLLLAFGVLLERLAPPLTAARARGAALRQLAAAVAGTLAAWTLPACLAGYGLGLLIFPARWSARSAIGPLVIALVATVGVAAAAAWRHRRPLRTTRGDVIAARPTARRLVLELLLVAVAVVGIVTLRARGIGGANPLLSATPVVAGAAMGLVVLRIYPYPLALLQRIAGRGRTVVPYLGLAHAARQRPAGTLPALVLLLATAIAAFSATVQSTIHQGQVRAAWSTVGGAAAVSTDAIRPAQIQAVSRVSGVTGVVPIRVTDTANLTGTGERITLIQVDLGAYRRLVAGHPVALPADPGPVRGGVAPMLVSPALAQAVGAHPTVTYDNGATIATRVVGTVGDFPTVAVGTLVAIVPYTGTGGNDPFATTVVVGGSHLDLAALRRAGDVPGGGGGVVFAQSEQQVEQGMTRAPLVGVMRDGFGYGGLVIGGYGALAVLMALVIGARNRGRTVSYLRTLGMSGRQLGWLGLLELAPMVVTSVAGGWVLGLALPGLVGSALDLTAYTAGFPAPTSLFDARSALLLAAGLVLAIGIGVAVDSVVNARRRLGGLLRIGDQ